MKGRFTKTIVMIVFVALLSEFGRGQSISPARTAGTNTIGIRMLRIQPGSFTMGETNPTPASLKGPQYTDMGNWDERPVHRVTITKPFYISETPVTLEQYRQFNKDYTGLDLFEPFVSGVSWDDATEFCKWLSKKEGKSYRLPTEAEWEYAARAGTTSLFWTGSEAPKTDAPNPWGLKDIAYGVPEWVYDWHGMYADKDQIDPVGPSSGVARVVRDGGVEMRELGPKDTRASRLGFKDVNAKEFPSYYRRAGDDFQGFLTYPAYFRRSANRASMIPEVPSSSNTGPGTPYTHYIGFRIVEAALPATRPVDAAQPFPLDCVINSKIGVEQGPDMAKPYFKARPIMPIPPDNDQGGGMEAVGLHPAIGGHIHSGGIVLAPNGDVLQFSFSTPAPSTEVDHNSTMVVTRLRHGADQWDMPDLFYDLADMDDQSALVWNDNGKLWFFGGGRAFGDVKFKYATSTDSGASWSRLTIPYVAEQKGYVEPQPITSAFRGPDGTIYFGTDAKGGDSLLWASRDNGKTWFDTGGRTVGRHTTFVMLRDGRILGMGGKSTDIDGYMPKTYSADGGKTWSKGEKTEFAALGGNQRPVIMRLKSGRLFFASDFQYSLAQRQLIAKPGQVGAWGGKETAPDSIKERGSFAALSDDEGKTWHIRKLDLGLPHESRQIPKIKRPLNPSDHDHATIGYTSAVQAPNGVIHLMTSMNHPSMHFELNEAWILSGDKGQINQQWAGASSAVQKHLHKYANGKTKVSWSSRTALNGDYVLHGTETWYYPDGRKKYVVTYQDGKKIGTESFWLPGSVLKWSWEHRPDGTAVWIHYWNNGRKKIESNWRGFKADGAATHWDQQGRVVRELMFKEGTLVE
ncbi:MAG: SUMF1/EgtB/PvdO family nonheme iron enzyme [Pyrinomonadaceae bacterium]|nr:SUMF1/EgtB/PvdO family nonheme iron enzyme [Pyrinomonadaceae bacterium]